MQQKLTILDIARLAGVGKSTVSRVLNKDPKVKDSTRQKVEQVIAEHSYVPSKSAQLMGGARSQMVGVIMTRLDSPSENQAVSGILQVLEEAGYEALFVESQFSVDKAHEQLRQLQQRHVEGVILFGFTGCDLTPVEALEHQAVVIAIDSERVSSVGYDNQGIVELAFERLQGEGVTHISYLGVDPKDRTTGKRRLASYLDCCDRAGIEPKYSTGELTFDSAYRQVDAVLTDQTQAIICATDNLALGAAKRLQELGRTDVQVSGVGATDLLPFIFNNTFSIDPGYRKAGQAAADLLLRQLGGQREILHLTQAASIA